MSCPEEAVLRIWGFWKRVSWKGRLDHGDRQLSFLPLRNRELSSVLLRHVIGVLQISTDRDLKYHKMRCASALYSQHSKNCVSLLFSMCNILICRWMQKHIQPNKNERTQFFRKIYHSLYSKGLRKVLCVRGELETEQNCNILTPNSSSYNSISFPFSWAAQLGAWGLNLCWDMVPFLHLLSN